MVASMAVTMAVMMVDEMVASMVVTMAVMMVA